MINWSLKVCWNPERNNGQSNDFISIELFVLKKKTAKSMRNRLSD